MDFGGVISLTKEMVTDCYYITETLFKNYSAILDPESRIVFMDQIKRSQSNCGQISSSLQGYLDSLSGGKGQSSGSLQTGTDSLLEAMSSFKMIMKEVIQKRSAPDPESKIKLKSSYDTLNKASTDLIRQLTHLKQVMSEVQPNQNVRITMTKPKQEENQTTTNLEDQTKSNYFEYTSQSPRVTNPDSSHVIVSSPNLDASDLDQLRSSVASLNQGCGNAMLAMNQSCDAASRRDKETAIDRLKLMIQFLKDSTHVAKELELDLQCDMLQRLSTDLVRAIKDALRPTATPEVLQKLSKIKEGFSRCLLLLLRDIEKGLQMKEEATQNTIREERLARKKNRPNSSLQQPQILPPISPRRRSVLAAHDVAKKSPRRAGQTMSMMMRPNPPGSARLSQRGLQACQSGSSIQSFKERERDQLSTSSTPNVYSSGLKIGVGDGGVMDEKKKRVSLSPSSSLESGGLAGSRVSSPSPIGESSSNFSSPVLAVPSSSSSSSSSPVVVGSSNGIAPMGKDGLPPPIANLPRSSFSSSPLGPVDPVQDTAAKLIQKFYRSWRRLKIWRDCVEKMKEHPSTKSLRKKRYVLKEVIGSETTYVKGLEKCVNSVMKPMENEKIWKEAAYQRLVFEKMFLNYAEIAKLNRSILDLLVERQKQFPQDSRIGDIFLKYMDDFLRQYAIYLQGYIEAVKYTDIEYKKWKEFLGRKRDECDQLVGSLLILPVQRLPRYEMFLEQLYDLTPAEHIDKENLRIASKYVKEMNEDIDRQTQNRKKLNDISKTISSCPDIVVLDRYFIRQGVFQGEKKKKRVPLYVFLFNNFMLITSPLDKPKKEEKYDFVVQVELNKYQIHDYYYDKEKFMLVPEDQKKYPSVVLFSEEKENWMIDIAAWTTKKISIQDRQ